MEEWSERARAWALIADVFGDLGEILGRGWDLALGILRHVGWTELLRLCGLVETLPELRELIRSLGRLQTSSGEETVSERIFGPVRRVEEELREVRSRQVPAETRGIERSGNVARMLPVEAAALGHAKPKWLWHARRTEEALLAYLVEGVDEVRVLAEHEHADLLHEQKRRPRRERGPIIAIVDSSGSMNGLPEKVAKAIVLEAARTAHSEKRRCLVYSFSGPDQVQDMELDLGADGIPRLLDFLGLAFNGGTDLTEPIARVLQRLRVEEWRNAGVVIVSDGEFPAPSELVAVVTTARESATRFHGIQIGNRGRTGLHAICDPVHEFKDWGAAGGWI